MKKATLEDWQAIAAQSKKARKELLYLLNQSSSKVPNHINDALVVSLKCLDRFRSNSEKRMMNTGVSDDINIFYGNKD